MDISYLCQVNEVNGGETVFIGLSVCVYAVNWSIRQLGCWMVIAPKQ